MIGLMSMTADGVQGCVQRKERREEVARSLFRREQCRDGEERASTAQVELCLLYVYVMYIYAKRCMTVCVQIFERDDAEKRESYCWQW